MLLEVGFVYGLWQFFFNGTHQLMVYADDVNSLGKNINIIKKNKEALSNAGKDVSLEHRETKYLLTPHQTAVWNQKIKILNKPLKMCCKIPAFGNSNKSKLHSWRN